MLRLGLATLIAGLTFIACSSGGSTAASSTPTGPAGGAKTASVTIKGFAFGPASVTIAKGGTVSFTNSDSATHTITSGANRTKDGKFDQQVAGGADTTITFDTAGTFEYFCSIHSSMKGTVVVQ